MAGLAHSRPRDLAGPFLPLATALLALIVDVLPVPAASPDTVMPALLVCVIFFWTIYRPDLLGIVSIFVLGFLLDAVAGLPLGLSAFVFLAVRNVLMPQERFLATTSFIVIWASFVIAASAVLGLRWLVASAWWGHLFELRPVVVELAFTVAIYPLVDYALRGLRRHLPKASYVSGS